MENNWISVEENLPNGYVPVLVSNNKGKIRICLWSFYEEVWEKVPSRKLVKTQITHWMPLPEPPNEE